MPFQSLDHSGRPDHIERAIVTSTVLHDDDNPALWLSDLKPPQQISHRMLLRHTRSLRKQLAESGVGQGDVVVLIMANSYNLVIAFLAVVHQGAIALPLNPDLAMEEYRVHLAGVLVKPFVVVDDAAGTSTAQTITSIRPTSVFAFLQATIEPVLRLADSDGDNHPATHCLPRSDDAALYLHTSGTTGPPKIVSLSHCNLVAGIQQVVYSCALTARDRGALVMPLFHVHGLIAGLLAPLSKGGSVVMRGRFTAAAARDVRDDISGYGATWYSAVPTIHRMILQAAIRSDRPTCGLRFLRSCSAPLSPRLFQDLQDYWQVPVLEAYGMTEASHQVTSNTLSHQEGSFVGTVGRPAMPDVRIIDDKGRAVPPHTVGQVVVRGASVTRGYVGRTAESPPSFSPDGFFYTGDLGKLDDFGFLTVTGRLKEQINRGGEKINPNEIERHVCDRPDIIDAGAFPITSDMYGEEVGLAIVTHTDRTVTAQTVRASLATKLAVFKRPRHIWVLPRFLLKQIYCIVT